MGGVILTLSKQSKQANVKLQSRDVSLLYDLYRHRVMHTSQLQRLHFPDAYHHSYKRLQRLHEGGYIRNLPSEEKRRGVKIKSAHYITDKGIRALQEKSVIGEKKDEKSAVFLNPIRQRYLLDASEIYTQVAGTPWVFHTAPEVKRKYGLNRNTEVTGSLTCDKGEYLFYLISERTHGETLKKLRNELEHNERVEHLLKTIVFYKGEAARQRWGDFTTGVAFHLLPFDEEGFTMLRSLACPTLIPNICMDKYNGRVVRVDRPPSFAEWESADGQMYVTELFTNDLTKKKILSLYSARHAKEKGKEVLILVKKKDVSFYKEIYKAYPHFIIVGIEKEDVERGYQMGFR